MPKEKEPFFESSEDSKESIRKKEKEEKEERERSEKIKRDAEAELHISKLRKALDDQEPLPPLSDEAMAVVDKILSGEDDDLEDEPIEFEFRPGDIVPSPVEGDKDEWKVDRIEEGTGKIWLAKKNPREPISELVKNVATYTEITAEELTDLIFEKDLDRVDEFLDRGKKEKSE